MYYRRNLIYRDPDDNKHVDCAVAARADYIVTNDSHFSDLDAVGFPVVKHISSQRFLEMMRTERF